MALRIFFLFDKLSAIRRAQKSAGSYWDKMHLRTRKRADEASIQEHLRNGHVGSDQVDVGEKTSDEVESRLILSKLLSNRNSMEEDSELKEQEQKRGDHSKWLMLRTRWRQRKMYFWVWNYSIPKLIHPQIFSKCSDSDCNMSICPSAISIIQIKHSENTFAVVVVQIRYFCVQLC